MITHCLGSTTDAQGKKEKKNPKHTGFHRMTVILHRKGNSQQSEEVTYRMKKIFASLL